ncbi:hypothetical protein A2837_02995 [Candidatus Kaiserbacteria bacterium RIFCSPHIGHO2_01_FULL_46_22]|uniref:Imelysin-like domain-containing protein n=1 Tax=Candidatus Kaiserbacteria bacterium RIFCSPHIGHO2_01_FULL_46_22 TaxID=1798475 RepID=A0A1F6BWZ8_9BACT|nr:MAG: hypothetical protein A2837_02995 [Candidatus Kaiserbacteria bacterium RIFCSPHIGHO2_01_FULL_46_22]
MSTYKFLFIILATVALAGTTNLVAKAQLVDPITPPSDDGLLGTPNDTDGEPVRVVDDISQTSVTSVIRLTLISENSTKILEGIEALVEKEKTLDPSAWAASKELQQQFTSEMLKWLGGQGEGQEGKVPFVQNYGGRGQEGLDKVAGSYLFDNKAGDSSGQCNVESSHKVRTAVYNAYLKARQDATQGGALACQTEESSEQDQNHTSLLHKLLGDFASCKDELCQAFDGQRELYSRAAVAEADDREAIRNANGFIPQRVCKDASDTNGQTRQVCDIVSPPSLAADAASFGLVQLPGLSLLNVDEFDEVVSNTMSNLTNQLINGQNGALGLTGNPDYGQNTFGENGNLSYADALAEEDVSNYQTSGGGGNNPIDNKIRVEQRFQSLMEQIVNTIERLETKLEDNRQEFGRCFDLELPNRLSSTKRDAVNNLEATVSIIEVLNNLNQQYQDATSSGARNDVLRAFMQLKNQGVFHTNQENRELELTFINLTFKQWVERFKYDTSLERRRCGGDFDYEEDETDVEVEIEL